MHAALASTDAAGRPARSACHRPKCFYTPVRRSIALQGDFLDQAVQLIVKQFKSVQKDSIYMIENKRKERYFDDDEE